MPTAIDGEPTPDEGGIDCQARIDYSGVMTTATRLTNPEIAATIHMSVSGVSRLRSGTRRPSISVAMAILDHYCASDQLKSFGLAALGAGGEDQAEFLASIWG